MPFNVLVFEERRIRKQKKKKGDVKGKKERVLNSGVCLLVLKIEGKKKEMDIPSPISLKILSERKERRRKTKREREREKEKY